MTYFISTKSAIPFVKAMAVVGKKHLERKEAHENLLAHIEDMKKASSKKKNISRHVSELNAHIAKVISAEKQFAGYDLGSDEKVQLLEQKISSLESQIQEITEKNSMQISSYKHTIEDMKHTFASLKTKLIELINDKREREKRMQQLHEKIQQGVSAPFQPTAPRTFQQPDFPPGFRY